METILILAGLFLVWVVQMVFFLGGVYFGSVVWKQLEAAKVSPWITGPAGFAPVAVGLYLASSLFGLHDRLAGALG